MGEFSIHKYCFLFFLCNLICQCSSEAAEDGRQARNLLIDLKKSLLSLGQITLIEIVFLCLKFCFLSKKIMLKILYTILVQVYVVYMGAHPERSHSPYYSEKLQDKYHQMLEEVVDGSIPRNTLVRSYKRSFNGFAAYLTKKEQQKLASYDEVVSIFPSRTLWPQTTRSWDYMGLREDIIGNTKTGSDIIIGVIDTGIWPDSKSFSDANYGPIPKKWKGVCHGGKNFTCNKKLIGARFYTSSSSTADSAIDTIGHGTHTASIAAGNSIKDASFYGIGEGTARGGVPSARIAAYKVCYEKSGCNETDILAAFDDAIADGVDIITISIGSNTAVNIKSDSIAIGSLHAMQRGILTVHSAGNDGSDPGNIISVAPWMLTVGASSMDREIVTKVTLGNGKTIVGKAINSFSMNGTEFPLVYGKDVTRKCGELAATFCSLGCVEPGLVKGKILLCDGERGIEEALSIGALGSISRSAIAPDVSFVVPLPASQFLTSDLELIQNYANSTKGARASILTSESIKNTNAPLVASFSSRGPNLIFPDILKPDVTAPGVDILAAYPPIAPVTDYDSDKRSVNYNFLSGTSMACPHVAGAAAYVKLAHPNWSPSALKSALMTTAWRMDPTKHQDKEFSYGSGHISPVNATNPGLVYETNNEDYIKMLCKMGYTSEAVESLFRGNAINCSEMNKSEKTSKDLNYPSMTFKVRQSEPISVSFSRTVTNVGIANSTYTASISKTLGVNITVEPGTLSFERLNEKKSFVVTVNGDRLQSMISASLVWSDGVHFVRSPVVLY